MEAEARSGVLSRGRLPARGATALGGVHRTGAVIDLEPGERVGDWIVGEAVGRGGMATVYRCASALSPRLTGALKVVDVRKDPNAKDRFVREIDTLANLRHQAVIRVLSAGEVPRRHLLYMVMELIEGEDLANYLSREALAWADAVRIFREVADGLQVAHKQGIHHRDIKPANVMITPEGGGVLVDFGIALDEDRTRLTQVGMVPGTVAYMPPELLLSDSHSIDPALADTYAFGLVLYEALTRQRAFPGFQQSSRSDLIRLVKKKLEHPPFDPGDGVPETLRKLVRSCTQANPLQRPRMTAVVRMLDLAMGPAPGLRAAGDAGEEATVVASAAPLLDLAASSYIAQTDSTSVEVSEEEMETRVMRHEDMESQLEIDTIQQAPDAGTPAFPPARSVPPPRKRVASRNGTPSTALMVGGAASLVVVFVVLVAVFLMLLIWMVL